MGTFLVAFGAASLALLGNYLMHLVQTKTAVRAERRAFVRELHAETVRLVVDLDLFVRSLRGDAIAGPIGESKDRRSPRTIVDEDWEDDLLKRLRQVEYGHPDPDVRDAAEQVDDDMWMYITMAVSALEVLGRRPRTLEERSKVVSAIDAGMKGLRQAVYAAPHRQVPKIRYDGSQRAPRTLRALAENSDGNASVK